MVQQLKRGIQSFDKRRQFLRQVPKNALVLELGCGSGKNCLLLKEKDPGVRLYGVDLVRDPALPDYVDFARVDLNREPLPFEDASVDVVIFTHVIEHLHSTSLIGAEIHRVMKPGGKIYLETPNWTSMLIPSFGYRRDQHSPFNFFDDPTHVRPWSKQGVFEFLLQGCNLEVAKVGTVRNWPRILIDPLIVAWGLLSRNRPYVISSVWNLTGWAIYGIARRR